MQRNYKKRTNHRLSVAVITSVLAGTCASALAVDDFATVVIDYTPAPGLFINSVAFNDPSNALGAPVGGDTDNPNNTKLVSLGGFGGSITLGFNKTVLNHPSNPGDFDAIVFGNAFWSSDDPTRRFAEAAHIEISLDENSNGIADDEWYVILGSSLPVVPDTVWREQTWDDDAGTTSIPPTFVEDYPDPSFFPGIGSTYTTGAYELPPEFETTVLVHPQGPGATEETHWGYADVSPTLAKPSGTSASVFYTTPDDPMSVGISPDSGGGDAFDIDWAVDPITGDPAGLLGFDFIRITTAVQFDSGPLGEISAEIGGVADVRSVILLGDINGDGIVDTADLGILIGAFGTSNPDADLNGDGIVDTADLGLLLSQYGNEA